MVTISENERTVMNEGSDSEVLGTTTDPSNESHHTRLFDIPEDKEENALPPAYYKKEALLKMLPYNIKKIKMVKPRVSTLVYEPRGKNLHYCNDMPKFMTTEKLDALMKKKRDTKQVKEKAKLKRKKRLHAILVKVEEQFRESAMRDIVTKFANYMANECINTQVPETLTESFKRMLHGLLCNLYMSLGIAGNIAINTVDNSVFETVAYVMVNMIIEANFRNQVYPDPGGLPPQPQYDNYGDSQNLARCLRRRALGATKKKNRKPKFNYNIDYNN